MLNGSLDALVEAGELSTLMRVEAPMVAWSAVHGLAGILVRRMPVEPIEQKSALESVLSGVRRSLSLRSDL